MIEAVRVYVRYDTKDEKGETRRERNEAFDTDSPPLIVPESGQYLWDMYFAISRSLRRIRSGLCEPLPPSEIVAHMALVGEPIGSHEYDALRQIDDAYCDEMGKELADYQAREKDRMTAEGGRSKPPPRRHARR